MPTVAWHPRAANDLDRLDEWRESVRLPAIAPYLRERIEQYFASQDPDLFLPGRQVRVGREVAALRMVLMKVGRRSEPYKVFYCYNDGTFEIRRIRHPRQADITS